MGLARTEVSNPSSENAVAEIRGLGNMLTQYEYQFADSVRPLFESLDSRGLVDAGERGKFQSPGSLSGVREVAQRLAAIGHGEARTATERQPSTALRIDESSESTFDVNIEGFERPVDMTRSDNMRFSGNYRRYQSGQQKDEEAIREQVRERQESRSNEPPDGGED